MPVQDTPGEKSGDRHHGRGKDDGRQAAHASLMITSARCTGTWFQPARPVGPHRDGRAYPGTARRVDLALT